MPEVRIPGNASPDAVRAVRAFRPNATIDDKSDKVHPHPALHYARSELERVALANIAHNYVGASVFDVGGNPYRAGTVAQDLGLIYHAACPRITGEDICRAETREATYERLGLTRNYCEHRAQDCFCFPSPTFILFVHSIYYFAVTEVAYLLLRSKRRQAFVVYHRFDDAEGSFPSQSYSEATYKSNGRLVSMQADGNNHDYAHDIPSWLEQGSVYDRCTNQTICVSYMEEGCGMILARLFLHEGVLPPKPSFTRTPPSKYMLEAGQRLGGRDIESLGELVESVSVVRHVADVQVLMPGLVISTHETEVFVPRKLYNQARAAIALTKRTPDTFAAHRMNVTKLAKQAGYSEEYGLVAIPLVAAMSFVDGAEVDIALLTAVGKKADAMAMVNTLLTFKFPRVVSWITVLLMILLMLGAGVGLSFVSTNGVPWWPYMLVYLIGMIAVGCVVWKRSYGTNIKSRAYDRTETDVAALRGIKTAEGTLDVSKITRQVIAKPAPVTTVIVNGVIPSYPASSPANLAAALALRIGQGTHEGPAWGRLMRHLQSNEADAILLLGRAVLMKRYGFGEWIQSFTRSEDYARVKILREAYERVTLNPTLSRLQDDGFVKDESSAGKAHMKPRAIIPTNPEYLVSIAPDIYSIGEYYKTLYSGRSTEDNGITALYASGYDPVELGIKYAEMMGEVDLMIKWDFACAEGTVNQDALGFEAYVYGRFNLGADFFALFLEQFRPVKTGGFERGPCRRSAVANTGLGNTLLFIMALVVFLWEHDFGIQAICDLVRFIGLGDDGAHGTKGAVTKFLKEKGVGYMTSWLLYNLGLKCEAEFVDIKTKWDHCNVEFCSGWFIPAKVEGQAGEVFVWTQKVGKVLQKAFKVKPEEKRPYAVLAGVAKQMSGAACPLLSAFAKSYGETLLPKSRGHILAAGTAAGDWSLSAQPSTKKFTLVDANLAVAARYPGIVCADAVAWLSKQAKSGIIINLTGHVMDVLLGVDLPQEEAMFVDPRLLRTGESKVNDTAVLHNADIATDFPLPEADKPVKAKPGKKVVKPDLTPQQTEVPIPAASVLPLPKAAEAVVAAVKPDHKQGPKPTGKGNAKGKGPAPQVAPKPATKSGGKEKPPDGKGTATKTAPKGAAATTATAKPDGAAAGPSGVRRA